MWDKIVSAVRSTPIESRLALLVTFVPILIAVVLNKLDSISNHSFNVVAAVWGVGLIVAALVIAPSFKKDWLQEARAERVLNVVGGGLIGIILSTVLLWSIGYINPL